MTLRLELSPEMESWLRRRAAEAGADLEQFVLGVVQQELEADGAQAGADGGSGDIEEWLAEFRTWLESHRPLPQSADDSRESIYGDRGA